MIWPFYSGCVRIFCLVPFGTGRLRSQKARCEGKRPSALFRGTAGVGRQQTELRSGTKLLWGLLPSPRAIFCSSHKLPPVSYPPLLVSYMVWPVEPGLTIVLGTLGLPPNGQRQGDGRQCVGRGHRLENKLRALGHCPVQGPLMALTMRTRKQVTRVGCRARWKGSLGGSIGGTRFAQFVFCFRQSEQWLIKS